MNGHARTAGKLIQILKVGGKKYTLRAPPIGSMMADMEAYIVSLRQNPFLLAAAAVKTLPPVDAGCERRPATEKLWLAAEKLQAALVDRIWKAAESASIKSGAASGAEMDEFTQSLRGVAYQLWTCLIEDHGDELTSVDDTISLIERFAEEHGPDALVDLQLMVHSATGEADAKNSSGPTPKGSRSGKRKKRKKNLRDGQQSTNSSPPSTTSPPPK